MAVLCGEALPTDGITPGSPDASVLRGSPGTTDDFLPCSRFTAALVNASDTLRWAPGHTRSSQQKPQQHTMSAAYGQEPTARHWPLEITTMTRHAPQLHITVPVMGRCAAPEPQQTNRLSVDTGSRTTQGCDAHDSSLYSSPLLDDEYTRHDDDNSSKQLRHHHTTVAAETGRESLNTYVKTRRRVSWPS